MSVPVLPLQRLRLPALRWHRPLLWLAGAMAVLTVVGLVGLVVDHRVVTGAPLWAKPLKFSISVLVYSLTLSWLLTMLTRWKRIAWWLGTVIAVFLTVEMVIIVGVASAGTTSHFNVSTPFAAGLWATMAVSIVIVWTANFPVAVMLFRTDLGDRARSLAIRGGVVICLIGMGLAFLMTGPQGNQISNYQGIIGAHTVGIPDGGPGLPLLGWSTVAGDLRIPHFVGMHALQVIPLVALLLELAARRIPALQHPDRRFRVIIVAIALYAAVLAMLTVQALSGESIVRPDAAVQVTTAGLFLGAAVVILAILAPKRAR